MNPFSSVAPSGWRYLSGLALIAAVALASSLAADAPSQSPDSRILDQFAATGRVTAEFGSSRDFVRYLDSIGTRWIASAGESAVVQRRRLVALLALEAAARLPYDDGLPIVEWGCKLLRREHARGEFESRWFFASSVVFLRSYFEKNFYREAQTTTAASGPRPIAHLQHALEAFPEDARLRLVSLSTRPELYNLSNRPGIDADTLVRVPDFAVRAGPRDGRARIARTMQELSGLTADPEAGYEASARLGLLKFELGQADYGREDLRRAAAAADPYTRNLAGLGLGLALEELRDADGALNAYAAAVAAIPSAKASAVRLAALLAVRGRNADAAGVIQAAFGPGPASLDPWDQVVAPDRFFSDELRRLRELSGLTSLPDQPGSVIAQGRSMGAPPNGVPLVAQAPGFRARTVGVVLDVSVLARNAPVTDLAPNELQVLDNGEVQDIRVARVEDQPLDVSLAVDMFNEIGVGNPAGKGLQQFATAGVFQRIREDVEKIGGLLRPTDRLRLLLIDDNVGKELWALQPSPFPVDRLPAAIRPNSPFETSRRSATYGRMQALYDTVAAALLPNQDPQRRHLVVVFTDGVDGASVLSPERFLELSQAATTVMHVIRRDTADELAKRVDNRLFHPYGSLLWPPDPQVIERAAEATGGELIYRPAAGLQGDFQRIFDRFRKSYVARYEPRSQEPGWHKVAVSVSRPGKFDVRARSGYWIR